VTRLTTSSHDIRVTVSEVVRMGGIGGARGSAAHGHPSPSAPRTREVRRWVSQAVGTQPRIHFLSAFTQLQVPLKLPPPKTYRKEPNLL
jgi:hypothetical protein